jgi:hypothetical protein
MTALAQSIAQAIQQQEGYGTPGAVTINANNNPGALRTWPGMPSRNGFAVFPDYQTGFNALVTDVQTNINAGLSLSQFINKYAPAGDSNNPNSYIAFVSSQTGLDPNIPMNAAPAGQMPPDPGQPFDPNAPVQAFTTDAGVVDWGTLALVGAGLLAIWWVADQLSGR